MRKKQVLQLLTMLTATAAVCAVLFLRHQPMEVAAVRVENGNICRTVGVAGTVCYTQETPVTAMVSGMVDALYVIEGERVTQGQALARISGGAAQEQAVLALMTHLDDDGRSALTQTLAEGSVLRAPVSGIVQRVATAAFAPVQAGSIPMTIAAGAPEIVCLCVPADAEDVRVGQLADISTNGKHCGYATVASIKPMIAENSSAYRLILTPQDGLTLSPGIEVEAQITAEYHAQVTTLPLSAITPDETVWWIADGICTEIPAQIVQTDENSAWVSLPEGISVVNGEFDRCQQGVRVRIAEGTP